MSSDSIPKASSIPFAASNPKDFAKKKRANRSAKLKQCKLDARREQWLSQVKNKGGKEEVNGGGGKRVEKMHMGKEREASIKKLEIKPRDEQENEGLIGNYCDSESPSNSPGSHASSVLGSNDSGMNFTGTSSSSSSSSSGGSCSGCMSEEDEERHNEHLQEDWDGVAEDWEDMADDKQEQHKPRLEVVTDDKQEQHHPGFDSPQESNENGVQMDSRPQVNNRTPFGMGNSKPKQESEVAVRRVTAENCRAWRADDTFRPQSLPNLSKQFSFPMNRDRHCGLGGSGWACNVASAPTSCPICCEDLDFTDTSFLPCSCGFRLCLFCHKRILEEDGRCPGCRKHYDYDSVEGEATLDGGSLTFRLARSCSMVTRS